MPRVRRRAERRDRVTPDLHHSASLIDKILFHGFCRRGRHFWRHYGYGANSRLLECSVCRTKRMVSA